MSNQASSQLPLAGKEIASVVSFLASPEAAFVTVADIVVDGGFTA
jgi:3-oxoacyl-[acyl-carrier protein] reductase